MIYRILILNHNSNRHRIMDRGQHNLSLFVFIFFYVDIFLSSQSSVLFFFFFTFFFSFEQFIDCCLFFLLSSCLFTYTSVLSLQKKESTTINFQKKSKKDCRVSICQMPLIISLKFFFSSSFVFVCVFHLKCNN